LVSHRGVVIAPSATAEKLNASNGGDDLPFGAFVSCNDCGSGSAVRSA